MRWKCQPLMCVLGVWVKRTKYLHTLAPWGIHYFSFSFISNLADFGSCLSYVLRGVSFQTVLGPGFGL